RGSLRPQRQVWLPGHPPAAICGRRPVRLPAPGSSRAASGTWRCPGQAHHGRRPFNQNGPLLATTKNKFSEFGAAG
ncbi:MAG: hypothetical protein AB7O38_30575, partial [Pirellulaceae bacterium]